MKSKIFFLIFSMLLIIQVPYSNAQFDATDEELIGLSLFTNSKVYAPSHNLQIYGIGLPEENLILRLFAPDETIAKFDQLTTNADGSFNYSLLTWPQPSSNFPYGTYTVEVISTAQNGISKTIDVKFSSTTDLIDVPVERHVNTLVFAPETAAINQPIRVFVQTTSDGLLIGNEAGIKELLGNTHVHLPSGMTVTLTSSFKALHQGLYYVDYTPIEEGTHVFHVIAFSQGTTSHGSAATNVLSQDLGGISEQIIRLNTILDDTSKELDVLKSEIEGFDNTLETASEKIDKSTGTISTSVEFISEASSQLNSLLFPIIASIGIIVALQIAILARRR
ncbi:methyl-accepting chemotaxis protein [Nitrosopumilus sp.]|uniref:methyl-accepting chemotaxis protein n=1 Tax=Nitrosopumilus sp. TaxID=2024843 RepID=UPI003D133674